MRLKSYGDMNLCTHCNHKILYSHRAMGNERGNLAAFLALKGE